MFAITVLQLNLESSTKLIVMHYVKCFWKIQENPILAHLQMIVSVINLVTACRWYVCV